MEKTKIIFIGNYKGGVGKTTTTIQLAQCLSKKHKVLTLDLDPQSSLSELQFTHHEKSIHMLENIPDDETLNYVFDISIKKIQKYHSLNINFKDSLIKKFQNQYDFVCSSLFYNKGNGSFDNLILNMSDNIEYLSILKNYVDTIKNKYDFILIDCPPSNNLITRSAFLMSDYYLIPTILDKISTNGVLHYIKVVNETYNKYCVEHEDSIIFKSIFGNRPQLLGIFFNLVRKQATNSNSIAKVDLQKSIDEFNNKINSTNIHIFDDICIDNLVPIAQATQFAEECWNFNVFETLSQKILERIKEIEQKDVK